MSLERHRNNLCSFKNKFFCATCGAVFANKSGLVDHLTKTGHPQGIIKEKDSEVGVLDTTFPVVAMEDGGGTFHMDDIARDGYDDEVVLYLSSRESGTESGTMYYSGSQDELVERVHNIEESVMESDVDVMTEEVETAVLSIAPAVVDHAAGGKDSLGHSQQQQLVEHSLTASFVEVATDITSQP